MNWQDIKESKITIGILILFVAAIWFYNIHSISEIGTDDSSLVHHLNTIDSKYKTDTLKLNEYTFKGNFLDPFNYSLFLSRYGTNEEPALQNVFTDDTVAQSLYPPSLYATGIIEETAVLQNGNGDIYFVQVGDTVLRNVVIVFIRKDSVGIRYKNKPFTLTM